MKHTAEEKTTARQILMLNAIQQHVEEPEQQQKLYRKIKKITEITGNEAVTLSFLL